MSACIFDSNSHWSEVTNEKSFFIVFGINFFLLPTGSEFNKQTMAGGNPADLLKTFLKLLFSKESNILSSSSSAKLGKTGFLLSEMLLHNFDIPLF